MDFQLGIFEIELLLKLINEVEYEDLTGSDRDILAGMAEKLEGSTHLIIKNQENWKQPFNEGCFFMGIQ